MTVLKYKTSRNPLVQQVILTVLPRLAAFDSHTFGEQWVSHVVHTQHTLHAPVSGHNICKGAHTLHLFLLSLSYLKDAMQFLLSSVKKVLYNTVYVCCVLLCSTSVFPPLLLGT